ncbi:hypothetical protein N7537_011061 [Penicillium hordei]|uniref:Uncharacterized protein n=1 Tax=Penicillium hordei TaxID=40994 RepID=A0AAD6DL13_9EURO|nr:uncharacterized protein N7537_011061 [Penicillium hordei]KAJ5588383.1 hypothetical protein N7537_011061 [Penicillium hordei]
MLEKHLIDTSIISSVFILNRIYIVPVFGGGRPKAIVFLLLHTGSPDHFGLWRVSVSNKRYRGESVCTELPRRGRSR